MEPLRDIEPWFADGLEIRDSDIHGRGLLATRSFAAGTDVIRLGGRFFHILERRSPGVMASTTTPISECVLLAEPSCGVKDFSDYINHSCDPNIGFRDALSFVTLKHVYAGDELVADYAFWEADSSWRLKPKCNCASANCRQTVTGEDWKKSGLSDPNFRYFSPFIKRRILAFTRGENSTDARRQ